MDVETQDDTAPSSTAEGQDDYYYRVDGALSLRGMLNARDFLPARWDVGDRPWPHRSLLAARTKLAAECGIFRMSFWRRLSDANADLRTRGMVSPHLLLRARRNAVEQAFKGWSFEEDDFLRGQADLIWSVQPVLDVDSRFGSTGVPLSSFEVWEPSAQAWHPWHAAPSLCPDTTRLPASGWQPLALRTTFGPVLGFWKVLPSPVDVEGPRFWLLLTLDDTAPGSLGSQAKAIADALQPVMLGPLAKLSPSELGVLTVYPTHDRVWTEQYAVDWRPVPPGSWWAAQVDRLAGRSSEALHALGHHCLGASAVGELLRRSGLPQAKQEFAPRIWLGA